LSGLVFHSLILLLRVEVHKYAGLLVCKLTTIRIADGHQILDRRGAAISDSSKETTIRYSRFGNFHEAACRGPNSTTLRVQRTPVSHCSGYTAGWTNHRRIEDLRHCKHYGGDYWCWRCCVCPAARHVLSAPHSRLTIRKKSQISGVPIVLSIEEPYHL